MVSNVEYKDCFHKYSLALLSNLVTKTSTANNLTIYISFKRIVICCFFLYHHINYMYKCFSDLLISDYINKKYRFYSVYNILSITYTQRIFLNVLVPLSFTLDSITMIYPNACWYERECWDLYGIVYYKHNDLRRLLNDYGFIGFPLRKDFPLSGFLEVKFDFTIKEIVCGQANLVQEFRFFNTKMNWSFFH